MMSSEMQPEEREDKGSPMIVRFTTLSFAPMEEDRIDATTLPAHLLVVYRWLKSYETEEELSYITGFPEKNIRGWCKTLTSKIASMRNWKVKLGACDCVSMYEYLTVSLDLDRSQLECRKWWSAF